MSLTSDDVTHYYDSCENDYKLFWNLEQSQALHAGYWDDTTKNLEAALERENEILAAIACIQPSDIVLDAGCGIGGSALYLARHFGCSVVGITLSKRQVDTANELAQKAHLPNPPKYFVMDYTDTTFGDSSFDVVWGLESVCHANDKRAFLKEAFRLLKPNGRLIIADGFESSLDYSAKEQLAMNYWLQGWGAEKLENGQNFHKILTEEGFKEIECKDITQNVLPSSRRLYRIFFPALVYSKLGELFKVRNKTQTNNIWSAYYQYKTLKKNLWQYLIFSAKKP